ncbi:CAP domain-containing protein [Kocuria coralli]|uniref:CAP domain-containing protein n=1 Tax=Kocuria coralli TaxID=1461025 RepID=A0A5J5L0P4_9MICC|nr:CAP domain-containing protein [Kocuria coralli]KAA9395497.1 CAP domain-containing protein [Kocuria coralli]
MKKTLITTAAVLALAGAAAAPASADELGGEAPASVSAASSQSFSDAVAQEMLGMLNDARGQQGLAPLSTNADLTGIASGWSQHMASEQAASHSPTFIDETLATGSSNMAENVAYDVQSGKSAEETAQYFYDFWMNSPGHHANIMNPDLNAIGFSLAEGSNGYVYATQNFGTY